MGKPQRWQIGDLFTVQLPDGTPALGQVVGREPEVLNSVTCAFYGTRLTANNSPSDPATDDLVSCVFTSPDLLNNGIWRVLRNAPIAIPRSLFPFEQLRSNGWVGAKTYGSANVTEFLAAYFGLTPWDDWADPTYLDRLLIRPEKKPANVLSKHS